MNQPTLNEQDYVLLIHGQYLIHDNDHPWSLSVMSLLNDNSKALLSNAELFHVGPHRGEQCYLALIEEPVNDKDLIHFRALMPLISPCEEQLISRALQLITWKKQHQFCGQCGQPTTASRSEIAMICESCTIHYYPRISPCMMCLIVQGDKCLLAHHHRQSEGMYSTLAGFVEAGESIEQTVHREVMEEVGLKVNNLRYFASQPWPFPHQLMVGYFVDYESGDIDLQDEEIADAQWFRYDQLPMVPPSSTLSGKMIEAFVESQKND